MHEDASPVDLAALGERGFRIDGAAAIDYAGWSVSGAGDVNGDGRQDVIVGALWADNHDREDSGTAYVIFGKSSTETLDLRALGDEDGFQIDGAVAGDNVGRSVAGAGDVNSDDLADVIIGSPDADNNGREDSGSSYVIFGREDDPGTPDVREDASQVGLLWLGDSGIRIDGAVGRPFNYGDMAGHSVAGGDVNGDGRSDVIVGAPFTNSGGSRTGSVYVVYGFGQPQIRYKRRTVVLRSGVEMKPLAPWKVRRTGVPTFTVSPQLPQGLSIDPYSGVISGRPSRSQRRRHYRVTMTDLTGSASTVLRIRVRRGHRQRK